MARALELGLFYCRHRRPVTPPSYQCQNLSVHGFTLLPTLLAILILTSLFIIAAQRHHTVASIISILHSSEKLVANLSEKLTTISSATPCSAISVTTESFESQWITCLDNPRRLSSFPIVGLPRGVPDFSEVFQQSSTCQRSYKNNGGTRFSAPTHPFTCEVGGTLQSNVIVKENLVMQDAQFVSHPKQPVFYIASSGLISSDSALGTSQDLLILAGGDISLATLSTQALNSIKVTVISARGSIRINATQGNISLLLIGTKELQAPATAFSPPYPLPSFRELSVAGIIPRDTM